MRQLNSGKCDSRVSKRFEAHHCDASAFDRTMILLNDVVEVAAASHQYVFPPKVLTPKEPERCVSCGVSVECHLARPSGQAAGQCLAEERLCGGNTAIRA